MPDKAVLDLARLQEAFEDDVAGIADLLEMALGTGAKHVRSLREGIGSGDIVMVSRAAHSIKGSASNIGANAVAAIAANIEDRARAASWDGIDQLTADLENAYAALRTSVTEYRASVL